jgi:hypothetical protein
VAPTDVMQLKNPYSLVVQKRCRSDGVDFAVREHMDQST